MPASRCLGSRAPRRRVGAWALAAAALAMLAPVDQALADDHPIGVSSAALKRDLTLYQGRLTYKAKLDLRSSDEAIDTTGIAPNITGATLYSCQEQQACPNEETTIALPAQKWRKSSSGFRYSGVVPTASVPNAPKVDISIASKKLKLRVQDRAVSFLPGDFQVPFINCCASGPFAISLQLGSTEYCALLPQREVFSDHRFRFRYDVREAPAPRVCGTAKPPR